MERASRFLPDPLSTLHWIVDQVQGFSTRPDVGIERGLITRLVCAFAADPIVEKSYTSANTTVQVGLDNIADALSCTIHVAGNDIYYRVDGSNPNPAGDQLIQNGSIITLTGTKSMLGFQFISVSAEPATLYVTYYS